MIIRKDVTNVLDMLRACRRLRDHPERWEINNDAQYARACDFIIISTVVLFSLPEYIQYVRILRMYLVYTLTTRSKRHVFYERYYKIPPS
jgi:hypothetical protein